MTKAKYLFISLFAIALLLIIPNISNADVTVTKEVYANNGSAKFTFSGVTVESGHNYEFGLTEASTTEVTSWHLIKESTNTSLTIDVSSTIPEFTKVITASEKGYVTIRDKVSTETIIVNKQEIDLSIPYLNITNYSVLNNGKEWTAGGTDPSNIQINFWNARNSTPYYQYEKITDENVIAEYKKIKASDGDYNKLQPLLKKDPPKSEWKNWRYWNGYGDSNGYGYPEGIINVPENGLYYMWIFVAGTEIRNLYGYILVDNLQPEIPLDRITLPSTREVELGKTLTLKPTFTPEATTNKIVTWSSSDESVATVDNSGTVTPKKIGSTIITVTSQDGSKKATCTVTVVEKSNNVGNGSGSTSGGSSNNGSSAGKDDGTTAKGTIPQTGEAFGVISIIIVATGIGIFTYSKSKRLKDI